ncbi:MAG: TonB-dependent receptor [Proteobacteria bacterium]|nr:TonB-dependent receptor [Pseudomonadota bacterium]
MPQSIASWVHALLQRSAPAGRSAIASTFALALAAALLPARPAAADAAADAPGAAATAASAGGLEEITVTANKLSSLSAIDYPGTIQAIGGDALQRAGATQFLDVATHIPGLQFQDLGPGDKRYIIRGINSNGDATTGVYYDEAVISGSNANDGGGRQVDVGMYDLERIEVLRGPQGTLYGASSMSGTIRFITRKPQLTDVGGYVTGELSDTSHGSSNYNINGALNLPIVSGTLAARLVGWTEHDSGYIDQPRIGRSSINAQRTGGGRAELRYAPSDALDVVASVTLQDTHADGSSRYTPAGIMSYPSPVQPAIPGYPSVPGGDLINTDLTHNPWDDHVLVYGVTANYKLTSGTLTATANEFDRTVDFNFDSTPILVHFGIPVPAITQQPQRRRLGTAEIRYATAFTGPVNLVVGAFGQHENSDFNVHVVRTNSLGDPMAAFSSSNDDDALLHPDTGTTYFGRSDDRTTKSYAGFGELTWNVTEKWSVVGGTRYYHEVLDGVQLTTHPFGGFGPSPVGPQSNHDTFSKTTFKLSTSYKFDPAALLYATFSQGFRGGGLNAANLPFASGIPKGFGPDSLNSYELGLKGRVARSLEYDVAAYLIDWKSIQVSETDPTGAFPFTGNAGNARVKGLEASVDWYAVDGLKLSLAGSYQNAELSSDQPAIPGNPFTGVTGDRIPNVPKFQGSVGAEYSVPLSNTITGMLAADLSYRGDTSTQLRSDNPGNVDLGSYALLNLRAAVDSGPWSTTLFVRNATDKRARLDAISSTQDPLALITLQPRTYGLRVTRKF